MKSKTLDPVLGTAEAGRYPINEMQMGDRKKRMDESYENKKVELKKNYEAVSRSGDTLELSEKGKRLGENPDMDHPSLSGKKVISDSGKK